MGAISSKFTEKNDEFTGLEDCRNLWDTAKKFTSIEVQVLVNFDRTMQY